MLDFFNALPEAKIVVMTHGGLIRTMICLALGLDAKN
jgi:broad specificity phosphatase PhoE